MSLEGSVTKKVSEMPKLALWHSQQCFPNPNFYHILCSAFISLWNKDVKLKEAQRLVHLKTEPLIHGQKTAATKPVSALGSVPFSLISLLMQLLMQNK